MRQTLVTFVLAFGVLMLTAMAVVHRERGDPVRGSINLLIGAALVTYLVRKDRKP